MQRLYSLLFTLALSAAAPAIGAESELPVIELETTGEPGPEQKVPCTVRMVWLRSGSPRNNRPLKGQIRIRGASSQEYEKKSFALTLEASTRWIGLQKSRRWILNAAFVDCSLMRHKLAFDLFQSLSDAGAPRRASSSRFVEVNLNRQYHGVYLLMERVDRALLGLQRTDSRATIPAVVYKAIDHGANFGQPGHIDYEQHEPQPAVREYWEPLDELNRFVSEATDDDFFDETSGIGSRIDIGNVIDFHLLVLVTSNMDGADKNFFLARDAPTATVPNPKFFFVPWDYDATFGRNWEGSRVEPTEWLSNHLLDRLLSHPTYQEQFAARWRVLRQKEFSVANLTRMIDDNVTLLGDAVQRNERRWKEFADSDPGPLTFDEDVRQMKAWIAARTRWLDSEIGERTQPRIPNEAP